jgi:hypothetical protein
LYCGKDIDAFEPPRDSEFRFPAHRKYEERLRETLDRVAAPEPSPEASDRWMPIPAPEAMAREARLSVAYALCGNPAPKPAVLGPFRMAVAPAEPRVAANTRSMETPSAEPAIANARPQAVPAPGMPEPGFIPPDFHCENVRGAAVDWLEWQAPNMAPLGPRFALRPALDRLEEIVPRKAAPQARRPGGAATHRGVEAIAAGLFVAVGIWFGAGAAKNLVGTAAMSQGISAAVGAAPARTNPAPEPDIKKQPLSWVRSTISRRAAVELTDTFHSGMESWNAARQSWAPGWSRHPDGYVRTGQLALYRPSAVYSDYRLEFFAQIESKSMGWVVRARDLQNYYAMKFTVVDPGLRPVIAMVHYPVVGGKKGHRVEVPLSVMVHNNTPYHVEVEVRGNRVITSIEGQEVDRWIDDTLQSGGVGFFSEPGERARLYWMKLAANDDFLGRICAYLSGGSEEGSATTAQWRRLETPANLPQPRPGGAPPGRPEYAVLAAAKTDPHDFRNRRMQAWGFAREQSRTTCHRSLPA